MDQKSPGSDLFKTGYGYIAAKTSEFDISNQLLSNHCADQKTTQPPKHFYKYQDIEFRQLDLPDFNKIHNIKIQIGCTLEIKSQIIWIIWIC